MFCCCVDVVECDLLLIFSCYVVVLWLFGWCLILDVHLVSVDVVWWGGLDLARVVVTIIYWCILCG